MQYIDIYKGPFVFGKLVEGLRRSTNITLHHKIPTEVICEVGIPGSKKPQVKITIQYKGKLIIDLSSCITYKGEDEETVIYEGGLIWHTARLAFSLPNFLPKVDFNDAKYKLVCSAMMDSWAVVKTAIKMNITRKYVKVHLLIRAWFSPWYTMFVCPLLHW